MHETLPASPEADGEVRTGSEVRALGSLGLVRFRPTPEPIITVPARPTWRPEVPRHPSEYPFERIDPEHATTLQASDSRISYIDLPAALRPNHDQSLFEQYLKPDLESALRQLMTTKSSHTLAIRGAIVSATQEVNEPFALAGFTNLRQITHTVTNELNAGISHRGVDDRFFLFEQQGIHMSFPPEITQWLTTNVHRTRSNLRPVAASSVFPVVLAYDSGGFTPVSHQNNNLSYNRPGQTLPRELLGAYLLPYTHG